MKHLCIKFCDILSHGSGIVAWIVCTLSSLLAGYEGMLFLILFCVVIDAYWGITNAVHAGRFVLSDLMRDTIGKVLAYVSVFAIVLGIERAIHLDIHICSSIIVGVISLTELWSISGHILIRHPNIVFFRLLKPALIGEIARKLNMTEDEVKEMFETKHAKQSKDEA